MTWRVKLSEGPFAGCYVCKGTYILDSTKPNVRSVRSFVR